MILWYQTGWVCYYYDESTALLQCNTFLEELWRICQGVTAYGWCVQGEKSRESGFSVQICDAHQR
jgi:hypothetical protein